MQLLWTHSGRELCPVPTQLSCLWASMDDLVVSRSLRALLALVQSSIMSSRGLTLLVLEMAAIGEMLVGMSSKEASTSSMLAWEEVSTGWSGPSCFGGGVMRTSAWMGLLGDECSDSQLDASSTAQDRRLLTSVVILPSDFGGDWHGLAIRMVETSPRGNIFWVWFLHWGWRDITPQVDIFTCGKAYTAGQQLWEGGYNGLIMPIQTYRVDDLWASGKELADIELANLPIGGLLCPSLR